MRCIVLLCAVAGCTSPIEPGPCTVPCSADRACPGDLTCGPAGLCEPAAGPSCAVDGGGTIDGPPAADGPPPDAPSVACPQTWTGFGDSCYRRFDSPYNARVANQYCNNLLPAYDPPPHLVIVESEAEHDWITQQFIPGHVFTLGLYKVADAWTWVDGTELSGWNGFAGGTPPETAPPLCAEVNTEAVWIEVPTNNTGEFVCELDGLLGGSDPPAP